MGSFPAIRYSLCQRCCSRGLQAKTEYLCTQISPGYVGESGPSFQPSALPSPDDFSLWYQFCFCFPPVTQQTHTHTHSLPVSTLKSEHQEHCNLYTNPL